MHIASEYLNEINSCNLKQKTTAKFIYLFIYFFFFVYQLNFKQEILDEKQLFSIKKYNDKKK